jgi:hypothetical protein
MPLFHFNSRMGEAVLQDLKANISPTLRRTGPPQMRQC